MLEKYKAKTVEEAAEIAADFIYNYMYELGAEREDCEDAAHDIYYTITGEHLDVEDFFGLEDDDEFEEGLLVGEE